MLEVILTPQKYTETANKQAIRQNILQYQVAKIKVPVFILDHTVTSKRLLKLYSTFLSFKGLEQSAIIFNYTSKAAEIAALFGISKSKLDKQVASLIKLGLLSKSLKNLIIAPYAKLYALHPDQGSAFCYIKIKPGSPFEYAITAKKISKNLNKQAYRIINTIKQFNEVCTARAIELQQEYTQSIIQAFINNTDPGLTPPCNLDISLSQAKLAKVLGLKSQTGGYYWQQRLQALKYITVNNRQLVSTASTPKKNAPSFGRWNYNNKTKVSFITLPNALAFA